MNRKKLLISLIALAASLITLLSQPTLAYYSAAGESVNIITTGEIKIRVVEKLGDSDLSEGVYVLPGTVLSKSVAVQNICEHPCWVRIRLTNRIDGTNLGSDIAELDLNLNDWIDGGDGYYYYKVPLEAAARTENLFTQIKIAGDIGNSYIGEILQITVTAYAVQSENNTYSSPLDVVGWPAEG